MEREDSNLKRGEEFLHSCRWNKSNEAGKKETKEEEMLHGTEGGKETKGGSELRSVPRESKKGRASGP